MPAPADAEPESGGTSIGRHLTWSAGEGLLGPVVGREREIDLLIEILCRRMSRNALLVGEPGVGRSAIVEGLALRIAAGEVPDELRDIEVVQLSLAAMLAQDQSIGEIAVDVLGWAQNPGVILHLDDFGIAIGAGWDVGWAARLRPAIAAGANRCVGSLTPPEYHKSVEPDQLLSRAFQPIAVSELTPALTLDVLRAALPRLTDDPSETLDDALLTKIVADSGRWLRNRCFPEKALELLDRVLARGRREGRPPTRRWWTRWSARRPAPPVTRSPTRSSASPASRRTCAAR